MSKNKKVVRYRKPFNVNIGMIIFIIIFIYLIFNIFSYMTTEHISTYEVEQGTMAENNIYRGLILRQEQVYSSDTAGSLNVYVKEASRVGYGNLICSVDEGGSVSKKIEEAAGNASNLSAHDLSELEDSISEFQTSYSAQNFYNVSTFKEDLDSALNESLSLAALDGISDYAATAQAENTFHTYHADQPGIVVYSTDGYEGVTTDTFQSSMFDEASYDRTDGQRALQVAAGAPLYKLITSEYWSLVIPIGSDLAKRLADDDTLQLRFMKDNTTTYATYTITEKEGSTYLILTLRSGMVRYAKDRYAEVELLLSEETGLKIPNSSITEKEFYTVPKDFFMKGGDSGSLGILVQRSDSSGKAGAEFIAPTIYYETDTDYYIDGEEVGASDIIRKADSTETYQIGSGTASLQGVYNINKGYAIFKQIDILYQNEEYAIVRTGTTYGIALYDHIALDGSKIHENDLIN